MARPCDRISAVDLFSGAGGLTHGLTISGIPVRAGVDVDPACKYPYEKNNGAAFLLKSISDCTVEEVAGFFEDGETKLLAGCAPCQPFSTYTQKNKAHKYTKWSLLTEFYRLVEGIRPEIITMENVPRLKKHDVYENFKDGLSSLGYEVETYDIFCPKYGVPQTRKRLVLFASVFGKIKFTEPTHDENNYPSVRQMIGHLPPLVRGNVSEEDPLHRAKNLSEKNLQRIKASEPGGTWRDWEKDLRAECHNKETCTTYTSVYGRMEWDKLAPTITTQCCGLGNGRFGHPEQDRAISLREAALLQTFPEDYSFCKNTEDITFVTIGRLIGNAVPVKLGEAIGLSIIKHLRGEYGG